VLHLGAFEATENRSGVVGEDVDRVFRTKHLQHCGQGRRFRLRLDHSRREIVGGDAVEEEVAPLRPAHLVMDDDKPPTPAEEAAGLREIVVCDAVQSADDPDPAVAGKMANRAQRMPEEPRRGRPIDDDRGAGEREEV
jgi:hypothetical protein